MIALSFSFFITAIIYASVGFGGGSTYNALLVLAQTDYHILPSISLICNLIVVSGGVWRFTRSKHLEFKRILPWIITSIPAAMIGGMIEVSEFVFIGLLGFALLLSGIRMLLPKKDNSSNQAPIDKYPFLAPFIGGALGLLSGLVGIGGGIFLAPILHLLRWQNAKAIAGACSIFIFLNSLSGLLGQITKFSNADFISHISVYWALFIAVFIGGQIGSYYGAVRLNAKTIHYMTATLILYVAARLLWRWINM